MSHRPRCFVEPVPAATHLHLAGAGARYAEADVPGRHRKCPVEAEPVIFRSRLKAQEEVVGIVLVAGVQDVPGGYLQGVVLSACHRAAGAHLVAAGGPASPCCVLLKGGSYSAAASLRIDSEGFDIAFQERFVIVHYRGPALLGADHLDQVAQEAGAPGAVKGGEHVRFQRMRDAGSQIAVLGQHAGRSVGRYAGKYSRYVDGEQCSLIVR